MENDILQINYEIDPKQVRRIWLEMLRKGLPEVMAFWGIAILISFLGWWLTDIKGFFEWIFLFCIAVPASSLYMNYQSYMRHSDQSFAMLSKDERHVQLHFTRGGEGFECRNAKNHGFIAWESVKGVEELDGSFVIKNGANGFYIPKTAFRDESEIKFLRFLVSSNVEKNVKLLEER